MTYERITGSEVTVELQEHHELRPDSILDRKSILSDASPGAVSNSPRSRQEEDLDDRSGLQHERVGVERTFPRPAVYSLWLVEIAAFATAVVALIATAIILGTYNGRPLPDWPARISINAIVSVFAVILKATLMIPVTEAISQFKWSWYRDAHPLNDIARFDHASRGLWGSLKFIQSLHVRNLASLGAVITILAVASDPFIQQIIKYHPCQQKRFDQPASIIRTNNYTSSSMVVTHYLEPLMQAAIYQGAYNSFSNIEASCGTGNCTFPEYRTLGVCSTCEDITSSLQKIPRIDTDEDDNWYWRLPSGLNVSSVGLIIMAMDSTRWNETSFVTTELLSIAKAFAGSGIRNGEVTAIQCSLSPCVRTYRAQTTQGVFVEEHVATSPAKKIGDRNSPSYGYANYVASPMPCLIDGVYYSTSSFTEHNATNTLPTYDMLPGNATGWLPKECIYTFQAPFGLQDYLTHKFLVGSVKTDNQPKMDHAEPPWLGQLSKGGKTSLEIINGTWVSLADSMTANIRRNGNKNYSMPVMGVAEETVTYVSVRWGWIAYPAALLALTFVFLLLTVVESTNKARGRIWKGSPLVLLFHGLDGEVAEKYQDVGQVGQMEKLAKRVRVRIEDEGRGLKLVEVSS